MSSQAQNICYNEKELSKLNGRKNKIQPLGDNKGDCFITSDDVNLDQNDTIQLFLNVEFNIPG